MYIRCDVAAKFQYSLAAARRHRKFLLYQLTTARMSYRDTERAPTTPYLVQTRPTGVMSDKARSYSFRLDKTKSRPVPDERILVDIVDCPVSTEEAPQREKTRPNPLKTTFDKCLGALRTQGGGYPTYVYCAHSYTLLICIRNTVCSARFSYRHWPLPSKACEGKMHTKQYILSPRTEFSTIALELTKGARLPF